MISFDPNGFRIMKMSSVYQKTCNIICERCQTPRELLILTHVYRLIWIGRKGTHRMGKRKGTILVICETGPTFIYKKKSQGTLI